MGFLDAFMRDRRKYETAIREESAAQEEIVESSEAKESDVTNEESSVIETIASEGTVVREVVEREAADNAQEEEDEEPASEEPAAFEFKPIKTLAEKKPVTRVVGQTKILAVINQKGGVGKSTTAINLSAALGSLGKQVLLVDLDPQGNASSGLGIDKASIQNCIYDVLLNEVPVEEAIIPDICEGVDIVPATINLAGAEVELVNVMARENRLKDALGRLRGKYDYVLIDCPPSLGLLTVNALVASDKLLIPIQCEFYALEGVTKLLESMKRVKSLLNPSLDIFGVLMTMYDSRTTLSKQVVDNVRGYFDKIVFETMIPRTVKLSEAPSYGMSIIEYDPKGKGALSYMELAKEVVKRG